MRSFLRKSSSNTSNNGGSNKSIDSSSPGSAYNNLVARQDWEGVRNVLTDGNDELLLSSNGDDALHFACRFHPPVDVVRSTAEAFPEAVSKPDNMGRYPLHIASKWGAAVQVISYLAGAYPEAASLQDAMGKTPLHLFCESYARRYSVRASNGRPLKESMLEIVKILIRAAPGGVNLEDMDDMTALEYAIDAELDRKVVRVIQKACEKDWKSRRTPGTKHEVVERSLLEQSQQQSARLRKDLLDMTASVNLSTTSMKFEDSKTMKFEDSKTMKFEDSKTMDLGRSVLAINPQKQKSARAFAA